MEQEEFPRDWQILAEETQYDMEDNSLKKENLELKIQLYQTQAMVLQYQDKELRALYEQAQKELEELTEKEE